MTIIIITPSAVVADAATWIENHAVQTRKIHRLRDGTVVGSAGVPFDPRVLSRDTLADFTEAFDRHMPPGKDHYVLVAPANGTAYQTWKDDNGRIHQECLYPGQGSSIGCYRVEWMNYRRANEGTVDPDGTRCPLTVLAVSFVEKIHEINGMTGVMAYTLDHSSFV